MTRLALALLLTAAPALAEEGGMDHAGLDNSGMGGAMAGYMAAMDGMIDAMPAESASDADADFLLMMIPHHQSAIDMARVELAEGDDAATRALAQEIIDAQEAEIAEIQAMLEAMGVEAPPAAE